MRFLNPSGLWLLLGIPILIIIYLIKSQHEDRPVSSTYIWKLSSRFMKKKLPMQRLRKILLFILQLLMIITAAMMVARPAIFNGESCEYIAILDLSASMQTVGEDGKTRLERAVEEIEELSENINSGHKLTVILAADSAGYLIQSSTSISEVKYALKNVECTLGGCDIDEALTLAEPICSRSASAEVVFYTDCHYSETKNISVVNVNQKEWNVVVDNVSVSTEEETTIFSADITSYNQDATVTVGLRIDGATVDAGMVACTNGTPAEIRFSVEELVTYDTAEIFVETEDGLSLDNSYAICKKSARTYNILLVSESPFYLASGLESLGNCLVTTVTSLEEAVLSGYDLYLFDGVAPSTYPEDGAIIQFGTTSLPDGLSYGEVSHTEAALIMAHDGINDTAGKPYINPELDNVVVSEYTPLMGDSRWEPLFLCEDSAVSMTSKRDNGMFFSVISFDLHDTNLTLQADYILLLQNMLEHSIPPLVEDTDYSVGDSVTFHVLPTAVQLYVLYPNEEINPLYIQDYSATISPSEVGIYTAVMTTAESGEYADFFVHIPDGESNTENIGLLEANFAASKDITVPEEAFTELASWLAALLLLLVLLEWGCYYYEQY